ncbi:MAG TPA: transposase [Gemmataceae bacterium]|nr:transposase [Gemmataceae bacterium]
MIHLVDPRQNRLFDPFEGVIPPAGRRIIGEGWQGVFRHVLLEEMPVGQLARHFSQSLGAPTKELYAMAGLVFLADFFGWTADQAVEAYIFRSDVQYALNLEPGVEVCSRTVERYQKLFRDHDLAAQVFHDVTTRLANELELDIARQRLDSTHVFSHMASFGRTKLMAVALKRFLTQVKRHAPEDYAALPEDFRRRYEPAESQLFAAAKDAEARQRSRQRAAEDLLWIIEHFAECPEWTGRSTYKALVEIFGQQCEVSGDAVVVKAKTGGDRIQNPSDPEATYDAHKGVGYQVQIAEACSPTNEVQLITAALPQTACEADGAAVVPMLDQLEGSALLPEEMVADTPYCSDENVQAAAARGVDLVGPIPGREPASEPGALTVDDFAVDERTGQVEACPSGHAPLVVERDQAAGTTRIEMAAEICGGCPFRAACPIHPTRDGRYTLEFSAKDHRLAGRRREQETPVFAQRYAPRAGIESTNSGLKNRLGMDRLRVRGRGSVFRVILHKVAGWNVLRAAASKELRARVKAEVDRTLKGGETGANEPTCAPVLWPWGGFARAFWGSPDHSHRWAASRAA